MTGAPVVIDTNIVVAGLLTNNAASPVAQVLDGMLSAAFSFVLSEPLLAEFRQVLIRPPLRKLHGLTVDEIDLVLTDIAQHAAVMNPPPGPPAPDPGDQMLFDLLAAHSELRLVTGDLALLQAPAMQGRVKSAREFVDAG